VIVVVKLAAPVSNSSKVVAIMVVSELFVLVSVLLLLMFDVAVPTLAELDTPPAVALVTVEPGNEIVVDVH
jgi:hypothetical protein